MSHPQAPGFQDGDDTLYARNSTSTVVDTDALDGGNGTDKAQIDPTDSKTSVETLMA